MAEANGFVGLYRSDHFSMPDPPDRASLECMVSLAYQADHSSRIQFGPLVAPLSVRDPVMLARQAAALDDLSDGRMVLGVGAGWIDREHAQFGYSLGDMPTRYARWEEGLEVITRLLRADGPVSFAGRFYRLQDAALLPRPQRPGGPSILVGGTGRKRTLALAARFADVWNGNFMAPETFRACSADLDALAAQYGRAPSAVRRTVALLCYFGETEEVLERRLRPARQWIAGLDDSSPVALAAGLHERSNAVAGLPDAVIEQIRAYEAAGAEELVLQWLDVQDVDGAEALARHVLGRL
jgi:alkanesulfonate monooxygenase SsuD/methylene tetrahydromethanopterin reductase-like flavin-dependent oxidoreductase (luciferase family)